MMHVKMLAAAAAVIGGLGLASAGAAPLAPARAATISGPPPGPPPPHSPETTSFRGRSARSVSWALRGE